jgi:hypothetical protein
MEKSILLFTLSICVITACSQAAIFSDNFESGTFDQWTIGGRQVGRESIAEIVNRNSSQTAHLYQDGFSEIHITKTFSYQNELKFSFDMEAQAYSEAPESDSAWYAGAGVTFSFLDNLSNELGAVTYGYGTSTWPIEQNELVPNRHSVPVSGALSSYSLDVESILSYITIDLNALTHVRMRFFVHTSSNDYNMNGHSWVDNVVVASEPTASLLEKIANILDFIDTSVDDGSLVGKGPGKSGMNRLNTFIKMVENVERHINHQHLKPASNKLDVVLKRCSGESSSTFVSGPAVEELVSMLLELKAGLEGDDPIETVSVVDERHLFLISGSLRIELDQLNIDPATIIVWDATRTKFYFDFNLIQTNGITEIQIIPGGDIMADGDQTLSVDYDYRRSQGLQ